ncbi:uncharacterized protein [Miscanthus floridulus]|uniref:uncharacterized protein n=1 Tax=Miscanthus floridulus TaxID=154761 RepID=UPI00345998C7
MAEYCSYRLRDRANDFNTPLSCSRLTQAYIVDAYCCCVEDERLRHFRKDSFQKKYRSSPYKSLVEAANSGISHASDVGQVTFLPGSFTGSPRYYYQNYQDCVAICRRFGCPDLFITFTCNALWPEIEEALSSIPDQQASDRPDIVDRVFEMKLKLLVNDIEKNEFFGPTLADLLFKYQAHINVESVNRNGMERYLIQFDIHYTDPAVERLPVHLPLQNGVLYTEDDYLDQVINVPSKLITKLTSWIDANQHHPEAREHTYVEFPEHWIWHTDGKFWDKRRNNRVKVGRLANVAPNQGERFYLRMLLHIVKGPRCFSEIRNVAGHQHPTFRAACDALGLLGNDQEWFHAMSDAAHWAFPCQLRQLFVTLLLFCELREPLGVFDQYVRVMGEDMLYRAKLLAPEAPDAVIQQHIRSCVLHELEKLIRDAGYSLHHFHLPQPDTASSEIIANRLIMEELSYADAATEIEQCITQLNMEQRHIYDLIQHSISNNLGHTFFVYGYGGTGKTFLWNTLLNSVRSKGKIALAVASSGIAALLLPGGRTPHSRFNLPLDIQPHSVCAIKKNTQLAELIQHTTLIIWDEAPVNHRHCFEALDRTLRDIMSSNNNESAAKQFGGITVVLGGDFRQTLPIIPKAKKPQILAASITRSHLWRNCKVLQLTENIRLRCPDLSESRRIVPDNFAKWLLSVGDGTAHGSGPTDLPDTSWVQIPDKLLLPPEQRKLENLISFVYGTPPEDSQLPTYLCERVILAPTNEVAVAINAKIIGHIATEEMSYYSSDSIDDPTSNYCTLEALYPQEFLNTTTMGSLPDHHLQLKICVPIMLLRNLNPSRGNVAANSEPWLLHRYMHISYEIKSQQKRWYGETNGVFGSMEQWDAIPNTDTATVFRPSER